MQFRFLCCEKCQVLRSLLDDGLEKCEEIAFLRQIGSNICWRILSGMNVSTDVRQYMPQVIDIFKVSSFSGLNFLSVCWQLLGCYSFTLIIVFYVQDAFSETTAEHIDVLTEMVNA